MVVVQALIWLYIAILWLRMAFSWIPRNSLNEPLRVLERFCVSVTEPVLAPLRRVLPQPRFGVVVLDTSVLVVLLFLSVLLSIV